MINSCITHYFSTVANEDSVYVCICRICAVSFKQFFCNICFIYKKKKDMSNILPWKCFYIKPNIIKRSNAFETYNYRLTFATFMCGEKCTSELYQGCSVKTTLGSQCYWGAEAPERRSIALSLLTPQHALQLYGFTCSSMRSNSVDDDYRQRWRYSALCSPDIYYLNFELKLPFCILNYFIFSRLL